MMKASESLCPRIHLIWPQESCEISLSLCLKQQPYAQSISSSSAALLCSDGNARLWQLDLPSLSLALLQSDTFEGVCSDRTATGAELTACLGRVAPVSSQVAWRQHTCTQTPEAWVDVRSVHTGILTIHHLFPKAFCFCIQTVVNVVPSHTKRVQKYVDPQTTRPHVFGECRTVFWRVFGGVQLWLSKAHYRWNPVTVSAGVLWLYDWFVASVSDVAETAKRVI